MTRPSAPFRALVETVAPGAAAGLREDGWDEVARLRERTLADRRPLDRALVRLFLLGLELLPLVRFGGRFSRLAPAERARVLEWCSRCSVRLVRAGTWGVRTLALLCVYGRPAAHAELGYRPDRRGWEALS
jgi:hypothetical protein